MEKLGAGGRGGGEKRLKYLAYERSACGDTGP